MASASAPSAASRRPSANVAMFRPWVPSSVPTWPITPGTSRLLMTSRVPSSGASQAMPLICSRRGVVP